MALTNSQYDTIIREFEAKQNRNRRLLEERTAYVYAHIEGYREIDESIASVSVEQGKKLLSGDESALVELKNIIADFSAMKKQLLTSAGLPEDYLEQIYDCADCKDTGYQGHHKCHCFKTGKSPYYMSSPAFVKCWKGRIFLLFLMSIIRVKTYCVSKMQ